MEAQAHNLYEAPQGALVNPSEFNTPKIFSLKGRIGRIRYLAYSSALGLLAGLLMAPLFGLGAMGSTALTIVAVVLGMAAYVGLMVFHIGFAVRRMNDTNQSGWLVLLL